MKEAADARGFPNSYVNTRLMEKRKIRTWLFFEVGDRSFYYSSGMLLEAGMGKWDIIGRNINHKAALLIADKYTAKCHLKKAGFSVPEGRFFRRRHIDQALAAFDEFRKPLCVKPNRGSEARGVYPAIFNRGWYERAVHNVAKKVPNILIEESVVGDHFRFFYVSPHVVAVRLGRPLSVVGDGVSSIADLLAAKNLERQTRALPSHPPYELDQLVVDFLAMQNLSVEDVPPTGERIYLRGASNATAGADSFLLDEGDVHPSYKTVVEDACKSVPGLHYSGVDLIIEDASQVARPGNHWILELNASPAITAYYYPWAGENVDVAGLIMDFLAEAPCFS